MEVPPPFGSALRAWWPFIVSALLAAVGVRFAMRDPWTAALVALLVVALLSPSYFARRRVRQVLRSGDVDLVLGAWASNIERLPYPNTMGPLVTAAAFASCGWVDRARTALARSAKGPAWDAALEHRLFVETLLDAFEGDRRGALEKSAKLASLPLPLANPLVVGRVKVLRDGLTAFARAFAHVSKRGDLDLLNRASRRSPLVHWAMRYAGAVVAIDQGDHGQAKKLLAGAPAWPEGSAFHDFHGELAPLAGLDGKTPAEAADSSPVL